MKKTKIIIMGAAGRDFHNFNVFFKAAEEYQVVAFTATQIPGIEGRLYPALLAGPLYTQGIPILPEAELSDIIHRQQVDEVVFSYSDISHEDVMHKASEVLAAGADFRLLGPKSTMLKSTKPVISVCATRTGAGKSQTTRKIINILRSLGKQVVSIRHPMPYGHLTKQVVQRFATYKDLDTHECTIEEREEYEPHIDMGAVIFAGVDYEKILREAEKEADVIIWDGGNNDFPFYIPDLEIVVADPLRAGDEIHYHPGETNLRRADVIVINKEDIASLDQIGQLRTNIEKVNPRAITVDAVSVLSIDETHAIRGKKVAVIEDGPTVTHGGMNYGAGYVAARKFGAKEIISPLPYAVGSIKYTFEKYTHLTSVIPAMGYGSRQIEELEETIEAMPVDMVISGTPIDLSRVLTCSIPILRVHYDLQEIGKPDLQEIIKRECINYRFPIA